VNLPLLFLLAICSWGADSPTVRPGRAELRRVVAAASPSESLQGLAVRGPRLFYLKRTGPQQRQVLYMRSSMRSEPLPVLDERSLSPDGSAALAWWQPSQNGLLLAYGVRQPEAGEVELRAREVGSSMDLPDRISRVPGGAVAWLPDRTGFYYARQSPAGQRVLFHVLGTDPSRDSPVLSTVAIQELRDVLVSPDGGLLILSVQFSPQRCELLVQDRTAPDANFTPLASSPACPSRLILDGRVLYLLPGDARGRLVSFDLRKPGQPRRREMPVPGALPAQDFALVRDGLAALVLEDGVSRLQLHDRAGRPLRELPAPGAGSVTALAADPGRYEVFFIWQSLFAPTALCRYDARTSSFTVLDSSPGPRAEGLQLRRTRFAAADGSLRTLVLASQSRLKRDGENPAILAPLPGAGPDALPAFSPFLVSWLEQGGLWAAPEGAADAADLAAAGRWLAQQEYSRPGRIAIISRETLAPGQFAAVVQEQADGTALLLWEPGGRAVLPKAPQIERDTDIQAFLLWRMGLEKAEPAPKKPAAPKKK
jgi:prolyl oligopeptidase